jgi:hypothetical protein
MGGADKNTIAVTNYHYQQCWYTFSTTTRRRRSRIIHDRTTENDNSTTNEDDYSSSANHHGGDGGGMTSASTGMLLSTEQFLIVANELLDKVEVAVTKLKDCNEGIEIIRYPRGTISDDTTTTAAATTAYSNVDDDNENTTSTIIRHDGRLSIQIMSTGDLFYGGGTYWLTIHADYDDDDDDDASGGGNDSSSDVPPGSSSTTNGNNYGEYNNYITLQSPLSGSYMYIYNVITKEWVGSEDGHSLYGMFTRDWIRQCNGVPDL